MTNQIPSPADLVAVLSAEADDIASPQELIERARATGSRPGSRRTRRRKWLAPVAVMASVLLVIAVALTVRTADRHHAGPTTGTGTATAATTKQVTFSGVQLTVPATWPVIDAAHLASTCSLTFQGQSDRVFLGVSYREAMSCPAQLPNVTPPAADGIWMQPGGSTPPQPVATTLPSGQAVYISTGASSVVAVWYHGVSIEIGIGADPGVEQAILDSITYGAKRADSPVLGRCPSPGTSPPALPAPTRVTTALALEDGTVHLASEPTTVQPKVSAAAVWKNFIHDFGGGTGGALQWSIVFGSYSAQDPAHINPDNSSTPLYTGVPTWLIQGKSAQTDYGSCGVTVIAPYSADTGQSMGLTTIG